MISSLERPRRPESFSYRSLSTSQIPIGRSLSCAYDRSPAGADRLLHEKIERIVAQFRFMCRPFYSTLANLHHLLNIDLPGQHPSLAIGQTQWVHIKKGGPHGLRNSVFVADKTDTIEMIISLKAKIAEGSVKKVCQGLKIIFPKNAPRSCSVRPIAKITLKLASEEDKIAAINEAVLRMKFKDKPGIAQLEEWGLFQGKAKIVGAGTSDAKEIPCEKMLLIDELFENDLANEVEVFPDELFSDEKNIIKIVYNILCGAVALHDEGVVHRDMKMSNVVVHKVQTGPKSFKYSAKWTDLGLACEHNSTFVPGGTISTMSPETIKRAFFDATFPVKTDKSLDVWPLGMIIYILADKLFLSQLLPEFQQSQQKLESIFTTLLRISLNKNHFICCLDKFVEMERFFDDEWKSLHKAESNLKQMIEKHFDSSNPAPDSVAKMKLNITESITKLRGIFSSLSPLIQSQKQELANFEAEMICLISKMQSFHEELGKISQTGKKKYLKELLSNIKLKTKNLQRSMGSLIKGENTILKDELIKTEKIHKSYTMRFDHAKDEWNKKLMEFCECKWFSERLLFGDIIRDMMKLIPYERISVQEARDRVREYALQNYIKLD